MADNKPEIWQEILHMAAENEQKVALDYGRLVEYMKETNDVKRFLEALGTERLWAGLSPEQREELRRLALQDNSAPNGPTG